MRAFAYSSGDVRSVQYVGTSFAATREAGIPTTSSVRVTRPWRTVNRSPSRTSRAGLAGCWPISTLPERHASVARLRVLNARIDQSHLSRRDVGVSVIFKGVPGPKYCRSYRATLEDMPARGRGTKKPGVKPGFGTAIRPRFYFLSTSRNSEWNQSSISVFSYFSESSLNVTGMRYMNERSRSMREPSLSTFPEASVKRNERFSLGG